MTSQQELGAWYINRVRQRLRSLNKNWIAVITGEPGSGKSYAALSLGKLVGGEVHLVLSPIEFMQLIAGGKVKKGDVIIFDEAGVGMSARQWQSVQNQLLGAVLQTFRHKNLALIMTTPNLSFIDIQGRKLLQAFLATATIDYKQELVALQLFDVEVNPRLDKIYYKHPRFSPKDGATVVLTHLWLPKPDQETISWYEERKEAFTGKLNADALATMKAAVAKDVPVPKMRVDFEDLQAKVWENPEQYVKQYGSGRQACSLVALRNNLGLSLHNAQKLKALVDARVEKFSHGSVTP